MYTLYRKKCLPLAQNSNPETRHFCYWLPMVFWEYWNVRPQGTVMTSLYIVQDPSRWAIWRVIQMTSSEKPSTHPLKNIFLPRLTYFPMYEIPPSGVTSLPWITSIVLRLKSIQPFFHWPMANFLSTKIRTGLLRGRIWGKQVRVHLRINYFSRCCDKYRSETTFDKSLRVHVWSVNICGPEVGSDFLLLSPCPLFWGEGMRLSLNLELVVLSKLIDLESLTPSDKVADALQLRLAIPWW